LGGYISEPNIESFPPMNIVMLTEDEAVSKADIVLLLVDHHAFKSISIADLADKVVIDTRGIWAV
jgi:UDP-N-acetyl-D-mannosaminuronic acid dehydrogenase